MTTTYYLQSTNTQTTCDHGSAANADLGSSIGSGSISSVNVNDTAFNDCLVFDVDVSGDSPSTGNHDLSINVTSISGSVEYRFRVEEISGACGVSNSSAWSSLFTTTGVKTLSVTSLTWGSGVRLRVLMQIRRTGGHGNVSLTVTTDSNSFVTAPWTVANTYNETASGGVLSAGSASIDADYNVITAGGVLAAGVAVEEFVGGSNTYDEVGTGGMVAGGPADVGKTSVMVAAGGVVCSGISDVSSIQNPSVAGGVAAAGVSSTTMIQNIVATGGVVAGGNAIDELVGSTSTYNEMATGGVISGGTGTNQTIVSEIPVGGVTLAGTSSVNAIFDVAGIGGILSGGSSSESMTMTENSSGGISLSGTSSINIEFQPASSGGGVASGVSIVELVGSSTTYDEVATGGMVAAGSAISTMAVAETANGGAVLSGVAGVQQINAPNPNQIHCPCNLYDEVGTGGTVLGGSAEITVEQLGGGAVLSGAAIVYVVPDPYDGLAAVWPLDEISLGNTDEFQDRTRNNLHGTGGNGNLKELPTQDAGVFCLPSQYFDGRDYIDFPKDNIQGEFSISMWVRRADDSFGEKVFFSRGVQSVGHDWIFTIGTSYIGELMARIHVAGDEENVVHQAFSNEKLHPERWTHIGAKWTPSDSLRLYVDGTFADSVETPENASVAFQTGNHSYAGRWNNGGGFVGNIQEVRIFPIGKDEDYFAAEHENFCRADFYAVSQTVDEAVFG